MSLSPAGPRVGLFVTCLVDMFRPAVGLAAARLLEEAGCTVEVPLVQNCCGQPAHHAGELDEVRDTARQTIETFEAYDYVVAPSSACAGMLKSNYPDLFAGDTLWAPRSEAFAAKVHELVAFLTEVMKVDRIAAVHEGTVTYHLSCCDAAEAGANRDPERLLAAMPGLELKAMRGSRGPCGCCGSSRAMPRAMTNALAERKVEAIEASGATLVLGNDLGCMMGLAGRLKRKGSHVTARHIAEVLAGMTDEPPIGRARRAA
ncbi:(Fe-S)-binding protein [Mesorhizobium xinjiangense]|uniref:(Fe-S)-binding protein n=1 Tax=Mesorhizobium xinjiangense TaxID=2678685 RepID=UPI0012EE9963|nr:(Fe-S)-binding protein [Mesorhizobium xinjiangense]